MSSQKLAMDLIKDLKRLDEVEMSFNDAQKIIIHGKNIDRLHTKDLNENLSEDACATLQQHIQASVNIINKTLKNYGLSVCHVNDDPRGLPIGIKLKSGKYNTLGGEKCGYMFAIDT